MIKALAPLGLMALVAAAGPASAKTCPSGQIYRVSLHVCASKSANLRYYRGGSTTERRSHVANVTKLVRHVDEAADRPLPPVRPEVASLRGSERPDEITPAPSPRAEPEVPAVSGDNPFGAPRPAAAPFGALPSVSSFR